MVFHRLGQALMKGGTVLTYIIQYGCIAHCTMEFVVDFVICSGPSMESTIYSRDIILTEHLSPAFRTIKRGDIVVARSPLNPKQFICKRVVGVPGDKMENNTKTVPRGHVWLEGDNKTNSTDSRNYGAVPQALIRGRAFLKVWPLTDAQSLNTEKK